MRRRVVDGGPGKVVGQEVAEGEPDARRAVLEVPATRLAIDVCSLSAPSQRRRRKPGQRARTVVVRRDRSVRILHIAGPKASNEGSTESGKSDPLSTMHWTFSAGNLDVWREHDLGIQRQRDADHTRAPTAAAEQSPSAQRRVNRRAHQRSRRRQSASRSAGPAARSPGRRTRMHRG